MPARAVTFRRLKLGRISVSFQVKARPCCEKELRATESLTQIQGEIWRRKPSELSYLPGVRGF
jgi:hypothetical protein